MKFDYKLALSYQQFKAFNRDVVNTDGYRECKHVVVMTSRRPSVCDIHSS